MDRDAPPFIGPHNGRELELMLARQKPLAKFTRELVAPEYDYGDEGFAEFVENGTLLMFSFEENEVEHRYYCLPSEEWRVKVLELIRRSGTNLSEDDLHRVEGTLLGYEKRDIEQFIAYAHGRRSV